MKQETATGDSNRWKLISGRISSFLKRRPFLRLMCGDKNLASNDDISQVDLVGVGMDML